MSGFINDVLFTNGLEHPRITVFALDVPLNAATIHATTRPSDAMMELEHAITSSGDAILHFTLVHHHFIGGGWQPVVAVGISGNQWGLTRRHITTSPNAMRPVY
jgi:hypothetical protein